MHYYQHHIGDFIRDTSNLSDSQGMAYLRMLWMYYDKEQPLPNNPRVLAFKIGSDESTVSLILEAFFRLDGDVWRHSRCDSELAEYAAIRERNIANGKQGGRPKKTQTEPSGFPVGSESVPSGNPDGTQTEPSRNPNQEPVTSNQEEKKKNTSCSKKKSSSGTLLADDFELPDEWAKSAISRGMTSETCIIESEKFRLHHASKKTRSEAWARQWASWCLNWVSYGAKQVGNGMQGDRFNQARPEPSWMAGGF